MNLTQSPEPISRRSLHEELVARLRTMIVDGTMPPGKKVPEKDLCERFAVSRTPLREALKVLAADGLLYLEPNRGAWVTELTESEVSEVFPVLGALEALSGELACENITDEELAALRRHHDQMMLSYKEQDLDDYFQANQRIHAGILSAARNETLVIQCEALSARMQRARYLANISEDRWAEAVSEHEEIIAALEVKDGKALGEILKKHMHNKQLSILKWLDANRETAA